MRGPAPTLEGSGDPSKTLGGRGPWMVTEGTSSTALTAASAS